MFVLLNYGFVFGLLLGCGFWIVLAVELFGIGCLIAGLLTDFTV